MNDPALFKVVDRGDVRIYTDSLLFRAGDYPDKKFRMTPEELAAAAAGFANPVEVNLEHAPAMLRGKLGQVRAVWVDPKDPEALRGEVAIPKWLDDQLTDEERRVSAEFDRGEGKALVGLALTPTPRVKEAALMAAFTASQNPGDKPDTSPAAKSGERRKPMSFMDKLKALFTEAGIEIPDETKEKPVVSSSATDAKVDALTAKVDAFIASQTVKPTEEKKEEKPAGFSEGDAKRAAAAFATGLITDRKILPAERKAVEARYITFARSDAATFSDGEPTGDTPLLAEFMQSYTERSAHLHCEELLADLDDDDNARFVMGSEHKTKKAEMDKPINTREVYATFNAQQTGAHLNGKGA